MDKLESYNIVIVVISATLLFLLLVSFSIAFLFIYRKRKSEFEKQILQTQLEIQEQTFNYISQEIHDNVGQLLSLAKVQINIIEQSNTIQHPLLTDVKENITKVMTDLRDIAKGLSTDHIEAKSLFDTIQHEIQRINRSGFIKANLFEHGVVKIIDLKKKIVLFRIIQECLQNIIKHSKAEELSVHINYKEACIEIEIQDNGIGFDIEKENNKGSGLSNITGRASLVGGVTTIKSIIDTGTFITIIIPYD